MGRNQYIKIKNYTRNLYRATESVFCLALGEIIYFDSSGFNHMIYKRKDRRPIPDQIRRFKLFPYVIPILQTASKIKKDEKINGVTFWSITYQIEGKEISVVIRQIGNGRKHFFSVASRERKSPL